MRTNGPLSVGETARTPNAPNPPLSHSRDLATTDTKARYRWHPARVGSALGIGRRILHGEREGAHPPFIHRTGTQRTARRLLVDEDGPFAEGTLTLLHGGWIVDLVRHRASHARGERSTPSSDGCCFSLNLPRQRVQDATKPSRREGFGLVVDSALCGSAALAFTAGDVGVHGLVLPAVVPLVVDGQLGTAAGIGTDAPRPEHLVRPWERPGGCSPEPLVFHVRSHPSAGPRRGICSGP